MTSGNLNTGDQSQQLQAYREALQAFYKVADGKIPLERQVALQNEITDLLIMEKFLP